MKRKQQKKTAASVLAPLNWKGGSKHAVRKEIAPPEDVLAAAELAPTVFNIATYYRPIRLMREKGHSWRDLAEWLKPFNIEVSYAHLRRLFVQEGKRLTKLNEKGWTDLGMPEEQAKAFVEKNDPVKRLSAADPEDEDGEDLEERPRT